MSFLGHTVAMVTYYATKMITTCSSMIGQFFLRVVIINHQNLTAGKRVPYTFFVACEWAFLLCVKHE